MNRIIPAAPHKIPPAVIIMIITKVLILICAQLLKEILHMLPKLGQLKTKMTPNGYQIELNVIQILQWVKEKIS
jgi:hypothetical protein